MSNRSPHTSQRAAQKVATRERILDGLVTLLAGGSGDLSIERLAESVGVSARTVYVHFPDRDSLLGALDERVNRALLHQPEYESPADLIRKTAEEHRDASAKADLVRAQLNSQVGTEIRGRSRRERSDRVRSALAPALAGLPDDEAEERAAIILLLRSIDTWKILHDDLGLDGESTARAVEWAMRTLIGDLERLQDKP